MIRVPRFNYCETGKRIQAGDEFAFEGIFHKLYKPVYNRAFAVLKNHHDADVASQDVFIKLWEKKSKWEPSGGEFLGWFLILAERSIIDAYRKQQRSQKYTTSIDSIVTSDAPSETETLTFLECIRDPQPEALELILADEAMQLIEEAVLSVPNPKHRLAWILHRFEGYKHSKIAEIMRAPENTCKIWIFRCQKQIREVLQEIDGQ